MRKQNQSGNGVPARRGASLLSDQAWVEIERTLKLTRRESQIVQCVFDNLPERGIARRLRISEHTVHTHLNRLFKKLAVTTRTELVLCVMEQVMALAPLAAVASLTSPAPGPAFESRGLPRTPAPAIRL